MNDDYDPHREALKLLGWSSLGALFAILWTVAAFAGDGNRIDPDHDGNAGPFNDPVIEIWEECPKDPREDKDLTEEQAEQIEELEGVMGLGCKVGHKYVWVPSYPGKKPAVCIREKQKHSAICVYVSDDGEGAEFIRILPAGEST